MVFIEASDSFAPDGDLVVPAGELIPQLPNLDIIPDVLHPTTYEWPPHCIQGTE